MNDLENFKKLLGETPNFKCILGCLLGLSPTEIEAYLTLYKYGETGVDELAKVMGKDKTTIYRSLQTLMERGLVNRKYRILRQGGYKYLYQPVPLKELKTKLQDELERWYKRLNKVIESFEIEG